MLQLSYLVCNNFQTCITVFMDCSDGSTFYEVDDIPSRKKRRVTLGIYADKEVLAEFNKTKEPAVEKSNNYFLNRRAQLSQKAYGIILNCVRATMQNEWALFQG